MTVDLDQIGMSSWKDATIDKKRFYHNEYMHLLNAILQYWYWYCGDINSYAVQLLSADHAAVIIS